MLKRSRKAAAALCALAVTFSCMSPLGAAAYELGELQTAGLELFAASGSVEINSTNFPDDNFRACISYDFDTDKNGVLSQEEIDAAEVMYIGWMNEPYHIKSLKGIEYFTNVKEIQCGGNDLTSIDLSNNTALKFLDCSSNLLTNINVSNCTALKTLKCESNDLTSLDLSNNTALEELDCIFNDLTSIDLSNNTALKNWSATKISSQALI